MPAAKKYDDEAQACAVRMYVDRVAEGGGSQVQDRREVGGGWGSAWQRRGTEFVVIW